MDRRSWLWRRKSSEKSPGETESSGSISSLSERFSDDQVGIIMEVVSVCLNCQCFTIFIAQMCLLGLMSQFAITVVVLLRS